MRRRVSRRRGGAVLPPGTYAKLRAMREREEERKRRESEQAHESDRGDSELRERR